MRLQEVKCKSGEGDENSESGKMHHGFDKYSNGMPKVAPWRVAILAKMAILMKIRLRCSETCNGLLKRGPFIGDKSDKKIAISTGTSPIIHLINQACGKFLGAKFAPHNFAQALFLISPGYYSRPKRNWKQCSCKILGDK